MEAVVSSTSASTARPANRAVGPRTGPAPSSGPEEKSKARAVGKAAVRQNESTGGGGSLAVTDLSPKPQPAWGNDPFNTRMHLEQSRLFNKSDSGSARSAMRMYKSVAHG